MKCWGFVEIEFLDKNLNFRIVQKFLIFDIWDAHMLFEEQDDRKKLNSSLLRCKRQFFELPIGIWQLRRILDLQLYFPFQRRKKKKKKEKMVANIISLRKKSVRTIFITSFQWLIIRATKRLKNHYNY